MKYNFEGDYEIHLLYCKAAYKSTAANHFTPLLKKKESTAESEDCTKYCLKTKPDDIITCRYCNRRYHRICALGASLKDDECGCHMIKEVLEERYLKDEYESKTISFNLSAQICLCVLVSRSLEIVQSMKNEK